MPVNNTLPEHVTTSRAAGAAPGQTTLVEADAAVAAEVKALLGRGETAPARERFALLIDRHQRRASRIAYHYLRNAADADEAVQDAFVKSYTRLQTYREDLPFGTWFTRILVNACLDRVKARARRERWLVPAADGDAQERETAIAAGDTPEEGVLRRERHQQLTDALDQLPGRQRTVVLLTHFEGCSPKEVAAATGLRESTVRVHLFRGLRNLRKVLGRSDAAAVTNTSERT
jgi:RNA polymerase sigma-70 factor (ECF subfamily)